MLFYIFIAFLTPFFYALSVTIESMLSNRCFKHQTTMLFYVSLMNVVFLPLILIFGFPDIPSQYCMRLYLLLYINHSRSYSGSIKNKKNGINICRFFYRFYFALFIKIVTQIVFQISNINPDLFHCISITNCN